MLSIPFEMISSDVMQDFILQHNINWASIQWITGIILMFERSDDRLPPLPPSIAPITTRHWKIQAY